MTKENVSLDFRLKKYEMRNCLSEGKKRNDLMSEKHKKVCRSLNYFGHFFTFLSAISGYFSISAFVSLVGVFLGISSSAVVLKTGNLIAGITKHKSIIKKKA